MLHKKSQPFNLLPLINVLVILASIAVCIILMFVNLPGMELLEVYPNWLLIWVVAWSLPRTAKQGAIAGLMMGCIYDGITLSNPSHIFSFVLVGVLTSKLQTQKYLGEDFISVALIVFFMTIFSEAIFAYQYAREHFIGINEIRQKYQQIAIASATLTSLWSPTFCYPLNLWQQKVKLWEKRVKL